MLKIVKTSPSTSQDTLQEEVPMQPVSLDIWDKNIVSKPNKANM